VGILAVYALYEVKLFGQVIGNDNKYFAYTPIQRIIERAGNLELTQTPHH